MTFNPFNKPIGSELTPDDLTSLIGIATEGYVIEFKEEFPEKRKVAHSVASFANTYGGWYILGVKTNKQNVAQEICGYDKAMVPDGISSLRDVVQSHIDPIPELLIQEISLNPERSVLVAFVPSDQDTPFITTDGRVYRRVHDSSSPISESDRRSFDLLIQSGRERRNEFLEFCQDERTFSQAEVDPWLSVYVSPYPRIPLRSQLHASNDSVQNIFSLSNRNLDIPMVEGTSISGHVEFNAAYPTSQSTVLRQASASGVATNSLEIELFNDGNAKIFIPLRVIGHPPNQDGIQSAKARNAIQHFCNNMPEERANLLRWFDVASLSLRIAVLFTLYRTWLGEVPEYTKLNVAGVLTNAWRLVPFFDADAWGEQVMQIGLPMVRKNDVWIGPAPKQAYNIPWSIDGNSGPSESLPDWILLSGCLYTGLGMTIESYAEALSQAVKIELRKSNAQFEEIR